MWLITVLAAVNGNARDGECFKLDKQIWRRKKQWYTEMYLHSAELNVVAVTENVNTFLLVWTHVSRYGVNWLYCCKVYKVLTVVMYSSQLSNYQILKCRPMMISREAFPSSKTSFRSGLSSLKRELAQEHDAALKKLKTATASVPKF